MKGLRSVPAGLSFFEKSLTKNLQSLTRRYIRNWYKKTDD